MSIHLGDRVIIQKGQWAGKYGKVIGQMGSGSVHLVEFFKNKRMGTAWFSGDYVERAA